jgi:tetratricopeptide (TPR) repeat protein
VAAYLATGDRRGAARTAVQRSIVALERLEMAVATGWQRRADNYLQGDERCREYGLCRYASVRLALVEGDADRAYDDAQRIYEIGRELDDADLEGLGLVYSGHALLSRGDVAQGLDRQSEAAAAVLSGEITPWIGSVIYCSLIWTCRNRGDWQRASQWTQNFQRWCDRHRLGAFPGTCRLHRAEVLSVSGRMAEAEAELDESRTTIETWAPWAVGEVQRVLGDLHLAKGDLDRAEEAYRRSREHGWTPQPGHAMLQVARGNASAAVRALETALADPSWIPREGRGSLLAHLAMAATAAGALDKARAALAELDAHPEHRGTAAFSALHHVAHATLLGAEGRTSDSIAAWRAAIRDWHEAGSPLYAAHARLGLGRALLASGERDEARDELMAARAVFEKGGAHAPAAQCAALLD